MLKLHLLFSLWYNINSTASPCLSTAKNLKQLANNPAIVSFQKLQGSYNFRQTKFKDFSRTVRGQIMVFNDEDSCNKSALFDPLLNALLAKTLNGVILIRFLLL